MFLFTNWWKEWEDGFLPIYIVPSIEVVFWGGKVNAIAVWFFGFSLAYSFSKKEQ